MALLVKVHEVIRMIENGPRSFVMQRYLVVIERAANNYSASYSSDGLLG